MSSKNDRWSILNLLFCGGRQAVCFAVSRVTCYCPVYRNDIEVFIPKNALQLRDVKKSSWSQKIELKLEACRQLSLFECQVQFLGNAFSKLATHHHRHCKNERL